VVDYIKIFFGSEISVLCEYIHSHDHFSLSHFTNNIIVYNNSINKPVTIILLFSVRHAWGHTTLLVGGKPRKTLAWVPTLVRQKTDKSSLLVIVKGQVAIFLLEFEKKWHYSLQKTPRAMTIGIPSGRKKKIINRFHNSRNSSYGTKTRVSKLLVVISRLKSLLTVCSIVTVVP